MKRLAWIRLMAVMAKQSGSSVSFFTSVPYSWYVCGKYQSYSRHGVQACTNGDLRTTASTVAFATGPPK